MNQILYKIEKYKIISVTLITAILYYCGYLSSDSHNRILGMKINYDTLDLLKWGGDFFIYSFIDCIRNVLLLFTELKFIFFFPLLFAISILLFFRLDKQKCFQKILNFIFCIIVLFSIWLSIHYTTFDKIKMIEMNLLVIYIYFLFLNAINVVIVIKYVSTYWGKLLIFISFLFLPALYGIYGRSYDLNVVEDTGVKKIVLMECYQGKYYLLERIYNCNTQEIGNLKCNDVQYTLLINESKELEQSYDVKVNFFDFIKDDYK